ncbi:hypothetical protein Y161_06465 [Listeria monocytogenes]|uniref:hypothetical protein n=1 Tax=Listeria monocytogenes TaxID=1639 RepID=UPI0009803D8D|nr:hypothetical protein [Listeria monocytogenes]AQP75819.1 hypothetical protein B0X25_02645 [Listeria monocytogenes]EAE1628481.1 hypothetical protein [Listeria monocytogenes]EAF1144142.1 hypothetical protein [Listeria monocytogenes]ECP9709318.1 hypothetical protein [Listeria monocytogenes]EJS2841726.1 hypothetical protein [Listeria monocytogenes]
MKTATRKIQAKKCVCVLLAGGILVSGMAFPNQAQASTGEEQQVNTEKQELQVETGLTDMEVSLADKYVSYNSEIDEFQLDKSIELVMKSDQVKVVENYIKETNKQLQLSKTNKKDEVYAISPTGEADRVNPSPRMMLKSAGVTRVDYHWNYCRIKISAKALKFAVGGGIAIAGVYAPARVVRAACAVAGLSVSSVNFKHGIWFDYNYFAAIFLGKAGKQ